jgi:hypothetical protein
MIRVRRRDWVNDFLDEFVFLRMLLGTSNGRKQFQKDAPSIKLDPTTDRGV